MGQKLEQWSLLVKPTHSCNLNCEYCYDEPFRKKFQNTKMSFEIVDKIAKLANQYAESVVWIWHGGEPTLMGIDWYKEAQEVFYKYYRTQFKQNMQTNGMLLNEDWIELSKNYGIDIGISYDVFSQKLRKGSDGIDLLEKIDAFTKAGLSVGTITVINKQNYNRQIELYEFLKTKGWNGVAFNHIYRTDGSLNNHLELGSEDYANEFEKYYNYWLFDNDDNALDERSAMEASKQVIGDRKTTCTNCDCRFSWIGVNPVGDVYPCDRYVPDKYYMGNVMDVNSIEELYESDGFIAYRDEIQKRMNTHCRDCGYFAYCQGGCNANHIAVSGDASGVDEFSCQLFRLKFNITYRILRDIDIYNSKLNNKFLQFAFSHPFVSVKEIKDLLKLKGYDVELEYVPEGKELLECTEFKLFRIFNVFKGEIEGHTDFSNYKLSISVILDKNFNMEIIREEREKLLNEIYEKNEDIIRQVLNR